MDQAHIAIVGGGIAGLAAGFELQQAGHRVRVFEAGPRAGGRVSSRTIDGYVINRGADVIPSAYTASVGLYRELGLIGETIEEIKPAIGFWREGTIHRFRPDRMLRDGLATTLLSWKSKLTLGRLALDGWRARRILKGGDFAAGVALDTEPAVDYAARRLNDEIRRYLIKPLAQGISARASVLDFFYTATMTMGSGFVRYPSGIGLLTETLAARLPVTTNAPVTRVAEQGDGVTVEWMEDGTAHSARFDGAIIAVQGAHVPALMPGLPDRAAEILSDELLYSPLYLANFGLREAPDETAGIVFMDGDAQSRLVSVSFAHTLRENAAPPGKGLLTVLCTPEWATAQAHKSDAEILDAMADAVEEMLPGTKAGIDMRHLDRWEMGASRAWPGYCASIAELQSLLDPQSRIQLAGDYFGSSSTNGAIVSAERAVHALLGRHI